MILGGGRRRGLTERRRDKRCLRRVQIRVIRNVENLPAKLHLLVFANWEEPRKPGVDNERTRAEQAVVFQVAESVCRRGCERAGVYPEFPILDRGGSVARWIGGNLAALVRVPHQVGTLCESVPAPREIEDHYRREIQTRLHDCRDGQPPVTEQHVFHVIGELGSLGHERLVENVVRVGTGAIAAIRMPVIRHLLGGKEETERGSAVIVP